MKVSDILIPRFSLRLLPSMVAVATCGVVVAGLYGMVHDQITFTLSPEYFTRLKFHQFSYADFGLAPRLFVALIGFLATWWVGFFAGWFLARLVLPRLPVLSAVPILAKSFLIVISFALSAAIAGYVLASAGFYDAQNWEATAQFLGVTDVPAFVKVAFIHNGSYLGGFIGLLIAMGYCKLQTRPTDQGRPSRSARLAVPPCSSRVLINVRSAD